MEGVCDCVVVCLGNEGGVCWVVNPAFPVKPEATAGSADCSSLRAAPQVSSTCASCLVQKRFAEGKDF